METAKRLVESAEALQLTLHGQRVGILTHYTGGKNILTFDPEYKALREPNQPTMTLTQRMDIDYLDVGKFSESPGRPVQPVAGRRAAGIAIQCIENSSRKRVHVAGMGRQQPAWGHHCNACA